MNPMIAQDTALQHYSALRSLLLQNGDFLVAWQKSLADQGLTELERMEFDTLCLEQIFRHATIHRGMDPMGKNMEAANSANVGSTARNGHSSVALETVYSLTGE